MKKTPVLFRLFLLLVTLDLAAAEKLINDCGYHRRDGELADAKQAILGQSSQ